MHARPRMSEPARLHKRNKSTVRLQTDNMSKAKPTNRMALVHLFRPSATRPQMVTLKASMRRLRGAWSILRRTARCNPTRAIPTHPMVNKARSINSDSISHCYYEGGTMADQAAHH